MPDYEPAVILSACRTPIGSFGGALKELSAVDLGAIVIREAIRRADIKPARQPHPDSCVVLDTAGGQVVQEPQPPLGGR